MHENHYAADVLAEAIYELRDYYGRKRMTSTSSEQVREEIARVLGKDRLHELDKPVFGGRQLSDKQIEEIADALTAVFGSQDADASEGGDRR